MDKKKKRQYSLDGTAGRRKYHYSWSELSWPYNGDDNDSENDDDNDNDDGHDNDDDDDDKWWCLCSLT